MDLSSRMVLGRLCLESQAAHHVIPLFPKLAHHWLKAAHEDYRSLALKVGLVDADLACRQGE